VRVEQTIANTNNISEFMHVCSIAKAYLRLSGFKRYLKLLALSLAIVFSIAVLSAILLLDIGNEVSPAVKRRHDGGYSSEDL
jgi:hypothetical protein